MKKSVIAVITAAVALVLAVVGWFIMPDEMIIQVNTSGEVNRTAPKILGLLIPLGITLLGAGLHAFSGEEYKRKGLVIAAVGIVAYALMFFFNLK